MTQGGLRAMEELGKLEEGGRTCRLPGECDRVPEPVREREPGGDRGAGNRGYGGEYGCGGDIL